MSDVLNQQTNSRLSRHLNCQSLETVKKFCYLGDTQGATGVHLAVLEQDQECVE